jgi:hypothetical protein
LGGYHASALLPSVFLSRSLMPQRTVRARWALAPEVPQALTVLPTLAKGLVRGARGSVGCTLSCLAMGRDRAADSVRVV